MHKHTCYCHMLSVAAVHGQNTSDQSGSNMKVCTPTVESSGCARGAQSCSTCHSTPTPAASPVGPATSGFAAGYHGRSAMASNSYKVPLEFQKQPTPPHPQNPRPPNRNPGSETRNTKTQHPTERLMTEFSATEQPPPFLLQPMVGLVRGDAIGSACSLLINKNDNNK